MPLEALCSMDIGSVSAAVAWVAAPLAGLFSADEVKRAAEFVQNLPPEDKSIVTTWLVFEGIVRITYAILLFLVVFLLGRRIIQAMIAGYREARAEAV